MSGAARITLVAWREIRERLRSKDVPGLDAGPAPPRRRLDRLSGALSKEQTYRVAVTAPAPSGLAAALQRAAKPFDDAKVRLRVVASAAAGRQALDAKQVDALLLLSTDRLVFRDERRRQGRGGRRHGGARAPQPSATGTGADHGDAPSARKKSTDAETLVAYARLAASAHVACRSTASGWSPASSRRRATASSS